MKKNLSIILTVLLIISALPIGAVSLTASVKSLTAGSKKLTVNLNTVTSQSSGYEIKYSTNKSYSNAIIKTVSGKSTSSTTLTGLKAKTTYYVKVRTYKTVNGVKYYSAWSSTKSKKTK